MTDKPKKSQLLTLDDIRDIIAYYEANLIDLAPHLSPGEVVTDLTLEQLIEIKFAAHPDNIETWLTAKGRPAHTELVRILNKEPARRGLKLKIATDDTAQNPREAYDHLGRMVCWHKRHTLGDEQPKEEPDAYRAELPEGSIVLDLYLYDHSGLRMSTNAFNDRWDSGQVGFIYATPEVIAKEFGAYETMTDDLRDKVVNVLEAEVKTYDDYLSGNVWGFVLENEDGDTLDSCWGFYGDDKDGIACHLPDDAKELLEDAWRTRGPMG